MLVNTVEDAIKALGITDSADRNAKTVILGLCESNPDFGDSIYATSRVPVPDGHELTPWQRMLNLWAGREFRLRNTSRPIRRPFVF